MLKTRVFDLAKEHGYNNDSDLARAMEVSVSHVNRVRRGERRINQVFINGARRAFPDKTLDDLFYTDCDCSLAIA